jgi:hypothetical protein
MGDVPWCSVPHLWTAVDCGTSYKVIPRKVDGFKHHFGIYGGVNEPPNRSSNLSNIKLIELI